MQLYGTDQLIGTSGRREHLQYTPHDLQRSLIVFVFRQNLGQVEEKRVPGRVEADGSLKTTHGFQVLTLALVAPAEQIMHIGGRNACGDRGLQCFLAVRKAAYTEFRECDVVLEGAMVRVGST